MATRNNDRPTAMNYESNSAISHPLMSWRSVIAGLLISLFSFMVLMSLGLALGGVSLEGGLNASAQTAGIISGVWFLVTILVSLFIGAFCATRLSKLHTSSMGGSQGLVLAALFFGVMFWQLGNIIGFVANTAGSAVNTAVSAAGTAANNPALQDQINQAAGNVSGAQISQQVDALAKQVTGNIDEARSAAAGTMQTVGWSLFISLILGAVAAMGGGVLGAHRNVRKPLVIEDAVPGRTAGIPV